MLEDIKILASRRAYEFRPDDLRLTTLCTKPVQEQLQQLFRFQATIMGTPMPTFGDVPATYPPGMVFDMGVWASPKEQLIPIRFLHFEQRRIVIDVAGPSSAIGDIYELMQQFLSQLTASDGSPIVGDPERVLDYSEITAHFPLPSEAMFVHPLRNLLSQFGYTSGRDAKEGELALVSTFTVQTYPIGQEIAAMTNPSEPRSFTLTLRPGTCPEERIYFSCAPLGSDMHLDYLTQLEASLRSND